VTAALVAGLASARPSTMKIMKTAVTAGPRGAHDLDSASRFVLNTANGITTAVRSTAVRGLRRNMQGAIAVSESAAEKLQVFVPRRSVTQTLTSARAATPVATPTPAATPVATPSPATTPVVVPTPTPVVVPTLTPSPDVVPTPTPSPVVVPTPTPSPVVTPTPIPRVVSAPTPTPTPTTTPTVTPTPGDGPSVPAGYTLVQDQTISNLATDGLSHRYYYKCTFSGGSSTSAVLSFQGTTSNVVFDSCTIATGGGWNGVSINDANGRIHDISFRGCLFKAQTRMGLECTSRPTSAATQYAHIDIIGCTFEPQGNEAVSYDGGDAAGDCLVSGNLIEGAGNVASQEWGAGLEINGPSDFTVTGNTIWQTRDSAFNFQRHVTAPSGWVVSGNLLDAAHHYQATPQSSSSQQVLALNVYGGSFPGNTVISAAPGGGVGYLSGSQNMNWKTTSWRDAGGRSGYATPMQVSCSGNQF